MKLYLSSYKVPTPVDLIELIGKPANQIKVALVLNAKDYYAPRAWNFKSRELVTYFGGLGLKADPIDLRLHRDAQILKNLLSEYDLIWCMGGNTFCLRYEMQQSGFDTIIADLIEAGIVYGGDSAGALVAGPSIRGVEEADEPEFAEAVVPEGLNLVSFVPLPHVGSLEYGEAIAKMKELYIAEGAEIVELTDLQALIVSGKDRKIVVKLP